MHPHSSRPCSTGCSPRPPLRRTTRCPRRRPGWRRGRTASAAELADALQDAYIPISAEAGKLLYAVIRASRPETVVEFGTSFGISTIYLAAAVTDNGTGHVVTTELSSKKVEAARGEPAARRASTAR